MDLSQRAYIWTLAFWEISIYNPDNPYFNSSGVIWVLEMSTLSIIANPLVMFAGLKISQKTFPIRSNGLYRGAESRLAFH